MATGPHQFGKSTLLQQVCLTDTGLAGLDSAQLKTDMLDATISVIQY
jgi:hypothetical protein